MPIIPANFVMPSLLALSALLLVMIITHFIRVSRLKQILTAQREHIVKLEAEAEASDRYGETFKNAARASVMAVGQELSSKLLEDHKRESDSVKNDMKKKAEEEQQKFLKQFGELSNSVAAINEVSRETKKQTETLWRTMSAPASTGLLTETSLENLLLNLGLQKGIDFDLQTTFTSDSGSNFRPDAIVYLPHDRLMVIDCKASKFELDLAKSESDEERKNAESKFRESMHKHIDSLARKNYMGTVIETYRREHNHEPHPQIINVMYIASDAAVTRLDDIDPTFREKMEKYGIIAVGPSGLQGLCAIASLTISELKRDKNREIIIKEIERLLGGLSTNLDHLRKAGNAIKSAANHYTAFSKSYNATLSPRIRKIAKLGVTAEGNKPLPNTLTTYEMHETDHYIEGDVEEEEEDVTSLEDKRAKAS